MSTPSRDDGAGDDAARIRIASGQPTDVEVAAVTAVLGAVLEQLEGEEHVQAPSPASGWERGRRSIRRPLIRGDWRSSGS